MPVTNRLQKILGACALCLVVAQSPAPAHASYEVQGLGYLGSHFGTLFSSGGFCINDSGQAAGTSDVTVDSSPGREAFLWDPEDVLVGLGDFTGGSYSSTATAINDLGQVAGWGYTAAGMQAFCWSAAEGLRALEGFSGSSAAYGINNAGQVVGKGGSSNGQEAFLWSSSAGLRFLGDLPGGAFQSAAYAVNGAGLVVGSGTSSLGVQAIAWDQADGMRPLESAPGFSVCVATAVNNDAPAKVTGYCYGASTAESYVWNAATGLIVEHLGHLTEGSVLTYAKGINDAGRVVGTTSDPSHTTWPFIFVCGASAAPNKLQNLIVTPGWTLLEANGINNGGQIVGTGMNPAGSPEAVVLNPATCVPAAERCADQIDNDCDGDADCGDADCAQHVSCITCYDNADCPWSSAPLFCQKPADSCAGPGRCAVRPAPASGCVQMLACGCDGNVYPTPCDAYSEGVNIGPHSACCKDNDGDGYSSPASMCGSAEDCNDGNAAIHPGAPEICDGKDNDCNGTVDDVTARIVLSTNQVAFQHVIAGPAPTPRTLTVTNPGCRAFSWSAAADASWLTLSPSSGVKGGSTAVGVNTAGLPAGVATATITIKDPANASLASAAAAVSVTVSTDTTAPTGSLLINGGASYTASRTVTLNLTAADTGGSGLDAMRFVSGGGTATAWEPYQPAKTWLLPGAAGTKTVFVQFRDRAGNISDADPVKAGPQSYKDDIVYDPIAPTGSLQINGGAAATASREVTLQLTAADAGGSGLDAMRLANGGGAATAWEPFQATKAWTLAGGAGTKIVYAQFRDRAGNVSDADPAKAGIQSYRTSISYTGP